MGHASTLTPRRNLHPLGECCWCGATTNLYVAYLLSTRSLAAQCEDPVECLRRRSRKKL